MRPEALAAAVAADLAAGRTPLAVLAVAGTTNTGAVDDLREIAALCRRYGVWLHVDAAYGGFAAITERGRRRLAGIELADSVTLDPHKWLYQPFECGAVLVREGHLLPRAFEIHPDYLQDTVAQDAEVNLADHGLQLTRMSRALKVWLSVRYFGFDAFVAAVDRSLDLAEHAQAYVEASPHLDLVAPATLGVVCFRRHPAGVDDEETLERLNVALVEALARSGEGLVSSTRLSGRYAIRACVLNHSTTAADVEQVLRRLETEPFPAEPVPPHLAVAADGSSAPTADPVAAGRLGQVPLLAGVAPDGLAWLATVARHRRLPAGTTVVRQWDVDRDFYLLLSGDAEIVGVEGILATLHAGEFFGELAALDWGAGFGYPRLATVRATTDLEVLVLSDRELTELMAVEPTVDAQVRRAAGRRATRI